MLKTNKRIQKFKNVIDDYLSKRLSPPEILFKLKSIYPEKRKSFPSKKVVSI